MNDEDQQIEARKRAQEFRAMAEEECANGGLLYGDLGSDQPSEVHKPKQSDALICPDHLSDAARAEWNRLSVEQKKTLTPADAPALGAYCAAYGRWADAELNIQKHGTIIKNKAGNAVANPYVSVAETSMCMMHRFLQVLQRRESDSKSVF
jgi:P27 family predicted phage terminase small subunit